MFPPCFQVFRKCIVGTESYGSGTTETGLLRKKKQEQADRRAERAKRGERVVSPVEEEEDEVAVSSDSDGGEDSHDPAPPSGTPPHSANDQSDELLLEHVEVSGSIGINKQMEGW
jgi:hypothetical protein